MTTLNPKQTYMHVHPDYRQNIKKHIQHYLNSYASNYDTLFLRTDDLLYGLLHCSRCAVNDKNCSSEQSHFILYHHVIPVGSPAEKQNLAFDDSIISISIAPSQCKHWFDYILESFTLKNACPSLDMYTGPSLQTIDTAQGLNEYTLSKFQSSDEKIWTWIIDIQPLIGMQRHCIN